ncbi:MAG: TIGR04222 domain-containing membrane protein [Pirellulales bacterium]|nr:TIGR04222 domain-containing membrane protein [Pirellulales bacterium]
MPLSKPSLWTKLAAFPLDDPGAETPFSVRLARDKGWSLRDAQRVVEEYRRFLYLTTAATEPACPSEEVDAAWHLHLCYTRSYWDDLCGQVLGGPLHHDPTAGGGAQLDYHRRIYAATLETYRAEFDCQPPHAIWPAVDERFAAGSRPREVDPSRCWIVPKPQVRELAAHVARCVKGWLAVGAAAVVPLAGAAWNPLDMPGPSFLGFYAVLLACATLAAFVLRKALAGGDEFAPLPELDPYETAVLAAGEPGAVRIALAELMLADVATAVPDDDRKLQIVKQEPPELHPLVQAVYRGIEARGEATIDQAVKSGLPTAAKIGAKLEDQALVPGSMGRLAATLLPALVVFGVVALGAAKINVGLNRNKPVLFLVLLCLGAAVIGATFLRPVRRTRRGDRLLRSLRSQYSELAQGTRFEVAEPHEQAYAMGLFGLSTLATSALGMTTIAHMLEPPRNRGGSGCSSGCSGSGGGSGCGGGGCGGCGGGD